MNTKSYSVFEVAFLFMMKHEGGFSDDEVDAGGATKYGVSLRFLKNASIDINDDGKISISDIIDLDLEEAKSIYYNRFWRKPKIYLINDVCVKIKCFDFAVNMGPKRAIKILQGAVNELRYPYDHIEEDGFIGLKTVTAIDAIDSSDLVNCYILHCINYYHKIVENKSSQKKFIKGWVRRARDMSFSL